MARNHGSSWATTLYLSRMTRSYFSEATKCFNGAHCDALVRDPDHTLLLSLNYFLFRAFFGPCAGRIGIWGSWEADLRYFDWHISTYHCLITSTFPSCSLSYCALSPWRRASRAKKATDDFYVESFVFLGGISYARCTQNYFFSRYFCMVGLLVAQSLLLRPLSGGNLWHLRFKTCK
jgi:hypothetical protein